MLYAVLLCLVAGLMWKLGFRPLRPDEEARLPSYYVKAERIQAWIGGVGFAIIGLLMVGVLIAEKLGFLPLHGAPWGAGSIS